MYSADAGGLHTDVQIELHLAFEMSLECKLGNCILSKGRYSSILTV